MRQVRRRVMFGAAVVLLSIARRTAALVMNTPTDAVAQCSTVELSWSGGVSPYYPEVTSTDTAFLLEMLDPDGTRALSGTWLVSVAAGAQVIFEVYDASGSSNVSDIVTVQGGTDASCLGQISFAPAGDNVYTSTTTVAGQSTAAAETTAATTTAAATTTSQTATSASPSSAPSSSSSVSATSAPTPAASASHTSHTAAIAGASAGAVAVLFLVCLLAAFLIRRHRRNHYPNLDDINGASPTPSGITPFVLFPDDGPMGPGAEPVVYEVKEGAPLAYRSSWSVSQHRLPTSAGASGGSGSGSGSGREGLEHRRMASSSTRAGSTSS